MARSIIRNVSPYPTIGRCVYCFSSDGQLTSEHIIPKALDGKKQLLKASCTRCQTTTKELEGLVCGKMLGDFRAARGVYSRPRKQPRRTIATFEFRDGPNIRAVPLNLKDQHPAPLFLPHFPLPAILSGEEPAITWGPIKMGTWIRNDLHSPLLPNGTIKGIFSSEIDLFKFARVVAKIAHCETVNAIGLDAFEPFLPGIIRGIDKDIPSYVGAIPGFHPPTKDTYSWLLARLRLKDVSLILHVIRIFGDTGFGRVRMGTPYFVSVVGRLKDEATVSDKLGIEYENFNQITAGLSLHFKHGD